MFKLSNFQAAMESNSWMEDGADVTVEQTIEVEVAADEETQETVEVEETIDENEEVVEETEEMLATLEYAAHAQMVVEEFGWSRPVATMLNTGQDYSQGGDIEQFLGISLPSNESLDMVSSSYDDTTVAVLESFGDSMRKAWEWIKKQAQKIWNFVVSLVRRVMDFFFKLDTTAKRYAEAIGKATLDKEKLGKREFKILSKDEVLGHPVAKDLDKALTAFKKVEKAVDDAANAGEKAANASSPEQAAQATEAVKVAAETAKEGVAELATAVSGGAKKSKMSNAGSSKQAQKSVGIKNSRKSKLEYNPALESDGIDFSEVRKSASEAVKALRAESSITIDSSGWTQGDLKSSAMVAKVFNGIKQIQSIAKIEAKTSKVIEKCAARALKGLSSNDDKTHATKLNETAKENLKAMKESSKVVNILSSVGFAWCRAFISAQRAMLACRS